MDWLRHRPALLASLVSLASLASLSLGCGVPSASSPRLASGGEGSLWLYLAPAAQGTEGLSFRLSGIAAEAESGDLVPLELAFHDVDAGSLRGERLLGLASLPTGSYAGLWIEVERAGLEGEQGEAELRVAEGPARVELPFTATRRGAVVLSLSLDRDRAIVDRYRFEPAFRAGVPKEAALGLFGVAASRGADTVFFYDKGSGRTLAAVPVGEEPSALALSRLSARAYVALAGESAVAIVGLEERTVRDRVPLGAGDAPEDLVLTPDGRTLLTANTGTGTVSMVDVSARAETERIRVGDEPRWVRVDPSGRRAFVCNTLSGTISVIDLARRAVAVTLSTEPEPIRAEFDRAGDRLYVIHRASPYLTVIDPRGLTVLRRLYLGAGATSLAVDPLSGRILVALSGRRSVEIYDPASLLPFDFLPVPSEVGDLAVDAETNTLHVAFPREDRVRVLRLSNKSLVTEVDTGARPVRVAVMGER